MKITELDNFLRAIKKVKDIPEYSIKDKLAVLDNIVDTVKDVVDKQKDEILKTCRYCKYCKQYYIKESWKVERKLDASEEFYWNEPKIEFNECTCPVGHKIRENIDHLYTVE